MKNIILKILPSLFILHSFFNDAQAQVKWVKNENYFSCRQDLLSYNAYPKVTPVAFQKQTRNQSDTIHDVPAEVLDLLKLTNKPPEAVLRLPPDYPHYCEPFSEDTEYVVVIYNIDANGVVENVYVPETSNACFLLPAVEAVCKWKYVKTTNGVKNAIGRVTFIVSD